MMSAEALFRAPDELRKSAVLSECGTYRYVLRRTWDDSKRPVLFVGLNPSTADAVNDDPTIRRCVRFAREWGYGGLLMGNLFGFRATDPGKLPVGPEAIGRENDAWLRELRAHAGLVVAAWGAHPMAEARSADVTRLLGAVCALGLTARGAPRHPLYVKASTRPVSYAPSIEAGRRRSNAPALTNPTAGGRDARQG